MVEHPLGVPVYVEVLGLGKGCNVECAVAPSRRYWLQIFGKSGLVQVQNHVT